MLGASAEPEEIDPGALFLAGGARVTEERFRAMVASGDPARAGRELAALFAGTALAQAFEDAAEGRQAERAALGALIERYRRVSRLDPLGAGPLLSFLFRLRAEAVDLRRIVWGLHMRAPAATIAAGLVTP